MEQMDCIVPESFLSDDAYEQLVRQLSGSFAMQRTDYAALLAALTPEQADDLQNRARSVAQSRFGTGVFVRGLIEISNCCRNNCYYCGIRRSNPSVLRYRLTEDDILASCKQGADLGFQTFVLQGGEDPVQDDVWLTDVVRQIRSSFPDHAITLSVGERDEAAYRSFREAGADRYLLRHETCRAGHYARLHPKEMSLEHRLSCLYTLKSLGFQTGAGMMIGSPGQTLDCLLDDLAFLDDLKPEMIGIGPFIPAPHTPFARETPGSVSLTLRLLSLLRLRFPDVLLPATTALATLDPDGREKGILAGANVLMPNLSPVTVRRKYALYAHKRCMGDEAAEQLDLLGGRLERIGYHIAFGRGDYQSMSVTEEKITGMK